VKKREIKEEGKEGVSVFKTQVGTHAERTRGGFKFVSAGSMMFSFLLFSYFYFSSSSNSSSSSSSLEKKDSQPVCARD